MTGVFRFLVSMLFTLWLAATLAFLGLRLLPGDAIQAQYLEAGAELQIALREKLHWHEPLPTQYIRFLLDLLRGDIGVSLYTGRPVGQMLAERFVSTAKLAVCALGIALIWGIVGGVGIYAAGIRVIVRLFIGLAISMPIYWTGTLVIFVIAVRTGGTRDNLLLPALVLGFHTGGVIARSLQTSIMETHRADFVRTARAKGLPTAYIIRQHILRASLLPVVQIIALQAGFLFSGAVITESLFQRAGIGLLLLDAVQGRDYPVVQGVILLIAGVYIVLNGFADMITHQIDPRLNS